MRRLWHALCRALGGWRQRGLLESRINRLTLTSQGTVKKQAGPVFTRQDRQYDPRLLIRREVAFLARLNGRRAPRLIATGDDWFEMEHSGAELNAGNLPRDWRTQIDDITSVLAEAGIVHRDIKPGNVLVKDGQLYLIDFGWAIWANEDPYLSPRELSKNMSLDLVYDNGAALNWLLSQYANASR